MIINTVSMRKVNLTGGSRVTLEIGVIQERIAAVGVLKYLYFLAKNDLPYTTKFCIINRFGHLFGLWLYGVV